MKKTQLEKLKVREAQIKARIQSLEAADKTRERKKDLRRKILLGAYVLQQLKAGDSRAEAFRAELDGYLTRDQDRALFGLEALPKAQNEKAAKSLALESA